MSNQNVTLMEAKNKKEMQMKNNSFLYFSLGLAGALMLSYAVLEMKTITEDVFAQYTQPKIDSPIDEPYTIQPVVQQQQVAVQRPITDHFAIIDDFIDDEQPIVDDDVKSIDAAPINSNVAIVPSNNIVYVPATEDVILDYKIIEESAIFPGCEKVKKEDRRACFQKMIQKHIQNKFHYPEQAKENNIQGRVNVMFVIEKDGSVTIANLSGSHKLLENEAKRIMSLLPKMTPGKQRHQPVRMSMVIPISFKME